jgi:t-SNARE complex subunit (syntaxin)
MVATTTEREESLTSQVTPILQVSNQKAQHVKSFLQRLSEENKLLKTSSTSSSTAASANEHRIRENLLNTLTRKFVDVMKSYQAEQQKFKTDIKKKMKRQIKVFNPEATEEEVEQVISSGHTSSAELLKSTILKGTPSELVQNAMRNVDEKNREVNALEASVTQLHEMFVDFAQLVEQQGELLDQIDYQVKQAGDFLDDANADMRVAVDYAIQLRKRQCCLAMILLVVVGVIVGIVFALKEKAS